MGGYMATAVTVEWGTPDYIFRPLNDEFHFTVDVSAADGMEVIPRHFNPQMDGLKQDWDDEIAYMNCPYGKEIAKWIDKASQSKGIVVGLLPAKTDTKYFETIYNTANEIRFISGRVQYRRADTAAPFGSMIVVWNGKDRQPIKISLVKFDKRPVTKDITSY